MDNPNPTTDWRDSFSVAWVYLILTAYLGTIAFERGDQIMRIWETFF